MVQTRHGVEDVHKWQPRMVAPGGPLLRIFLVPWACSEAILHRKTVTQRLAWPPRL